MNGQDVENVRAIAQYILYIAQKQGAEQCSVHVGESLGHSLQWREGQLEALSREQELDLSLTVYRGCKKGSVTVSDTREASLEAAVAAALTAAKYTTVDEFAGLADPTHITVVDDAQLRALDLVHLPLPNIQTLSDLAARAEQAACARDARISNSDGASAYAIENRFWYAASNGFSAGSRMTRCGVNVGVLAKSPHGQHRGDAYDGRFCLADLRTPESLGEEAADKAVAALDPQVVKTGSYPVIFAAEVAGGLIGHILQALGGQTQFRKLGFLTDAVGRKVLPGWLNLLEAPLLARGAGSALFDGEGIAVREPVIVGEGKVHRYLLGSYAARRLELLPTGNSGGVVHNLKLIADADHIMPLAQLYEKMHCGVIVTSLMGQGVNLLTGDYSRGASGFWVEDGKISHPLDGITIASNLHEMFAGITAIGNDVDDRGHIHAPSILIERMTIAR